MQVQSRMIRSLVPTVLAVTFVAVGAGPATAQQAVPLSTLSRADRDRVEQEKIARVATAERLRIEGETHAARNEWREAATRFERAAELRGDGDAETPALRRKAADAFFRAGESGRAMEAYERSAESAMGFGDIDLAADGYLKAALLAQERGDDLRANENGWKAQRLSGSAALSDQVKRAIRQHLIVGPSRVALSGGR